MCLSHNQIAKIDDLVANANISYSHLSDDLTDHICCAIEDKIQQGIDFTMAFTQVQQEVGLSGLRRVQTETLFLIDKSYRTMKKSMKVLGAIALAMMAIAAVFKIQHLPGAAILMTLSFVLVVFIFFPSALYVMYREVNQKKKAWYFILAYLGGVGFMLGTLFNRSLRSVSLRSSLEIIAFIAPLSRIYLTNALVSISLIPTMVSRSKKPCRFPLPPGLESISENFLQTNPAILMLSLSTSSSCTP